MSKNLKRHGDPLYRRSIHSRFYNDRNIKNKRVHLTSVERRCDDKTGHVTKFTKKKRDLEGVIVTGKIYYQDHSLHYS